MQVSEAINVGKRYPSAENQEIIEAHKTLDDFVDEVHRGEHSGVLHDELQTAKAWRLLLKQEMSSRKIGPFALAVAA